MPDIELTDVRMHYELSGHGQPVLMIPGLGQNCRAWDPIIPLLGDQYSLIRPDNRGIHESLTKRPARRIDDYVADFVELLDALQVDHAHVVGLSFGGVLAQRLASDHPDRVDRLVLISTTARAQPYLRQLAMLLGHALRHFPLALFFQTMELLGTSPEYFDAHEIEIAQSIPARCTDAGTRGALAGQLRCLLDAARAGSDRAITAPTLVLAGEYDALIPNCYGRQLSVELADGQFSLLKGCGHNPIIEQPQKLAEKLKRFLDEATVPLDVHGV